MKKNRSEVYKLMDHTLEVQNSQNFINNNLDNNIILDSLAKTACMSKYHYHRLFRETVGETVNKYVTKKRMENASKELIETDRPIIDIALKYQYGSQESFSRAFKRYFAMSPGKYRRTYKDSANNMIYLKSRSSQITDMAA